ncbi:spore coat polysaccharide biosynthesis predicted glycosyltransferase SpsG [Salinibacter ruber]|uniref:glycosyltransferase n=1 Tax=Salinibacter ruber TaxID=146919 RepID=UPI00216922B6|nr:glycosyltransferase [Salinibacter ruber]MCS3634880.1 spore coat polysaccharide biosynthesis predicted glycosyltransferase SpsG [Salinibacter ruber]MCS3714645.1 spore coat polysaccharide biosynthesis predicted glycosyltransferase SpsG [Salinibacter ruber]
MVVLLTEAGENIGLGHVTRCRAVAEAFRADGYLATVFADVHGEIPDLSGPNVKSFSWKQELEHLDEILDGAEVAFIDSYRADQDLCARISQEVSLSVVFDDFNRIRYPVDLILNPNPHAPQLGYEKQRAEIEGGSDFVILRPEFLPHRGGFTPRDHCTEIFITAGGDDYRALLPKLLSRLVREQYHLRVAAGSRVEELRREYAAHEDVTIHGYLTASEMASEMTQVDAAVSAAGQTLHELAFLGVPTVGICIDNDQQGNLRAHTQSGFLPRELFWDQENLTGEVVSELRVLGDREIQKERSEAGQSLIDGKGPKRIVDIVLRVDKNDNYV